MERKPEEDKWGEKKRERERKKEKGKKDNEIK